MKASRVEGSEPLRLRVGPSWIPLGFAREDKVVYLVGQARSARWPVAVLREGVAEIVLPEGAAVGTPTLVTAPSERERILRLFRGKYGADQFDRWYRDPARVLRVSLDSRKTALPDSPERYYAWVRSEFDNVADDYDRHITGNRVNLLLRNRSLAVLRQRFSNAPRVLEIGCGSGMETLPLLEIGHEVLAVDISPRMLSVVRKKAGEAGVSEQLTTRMLAARDLPRLADEGYLGAFDAAFSTYGALNCEPDLSAIPAAIAGLLKPHSPFVVAVYNRWCLFELLGYSLAGRPGRAFGRRKNPVPVGGSRFCVDVYAHSTSDFRRLFAPWFTVERLEAVPLLLPPSDLVSYADRFARHWDRLTAWDAAWSRAWPLNRLGDHFLMTLVRRS